MVCVRRAAVCASSLLSFSLLLACSSSSSSSPAPASAGFDCKALADNEAAANCPNFNGAEYLAQCTTTLGEQNPACSAKLNALGTCLLAQPVGCTDAGTVDQSIPAPCQSVSDTWQACEYGDAGR
jgi:hypothetical protein